ncbi:MAG TPA: sulfite exporter TauE/SafE family protein [Lacipirellula sp.]
MPYPPAELATIALVMTFGSVVQGAVGFASGLLGVPLLVLYGFSLLEATVINFISSSVQNLTGAVQLGSHLKPSDVVAPTLLRCLGLPLGTLALYGTRSLEPGVVQQIIGVILLGSIALLAGLRIRPRDELPLAWTGVAFLVSGFLTGFASIGGAPMVMYVNSLTWSAAKSRAFLFLCSALLIPLMGIMLIAKFGEQASTPAMAALMTLPPVAIGLWFGLKLGHRLDKRRFRRLTYALLAMIALVAILSPLLVTSS